jgi:Ca2+-binding EF-hand superfamily protein
MQSLFSRVDSDGNGRVDFEEFLHLVQQRREVKADQPELEMFRLFDRDGSGSLSPGEWGQVLGLMGLGDTTAEEAKQLFAAVDTDGDGRIGLEEFAAYIGN